MSDAVFQEPEGSYVKLNQFLAGTFYKPTANDLFKCYQHFLGEEKIRFDAERKTLIEREKFYRKRIKERKKKELKENRWIDQCKLSAVFRAILFALPENEYTRERRVLSPPNPRLSRDSQHRSWNGYHWEIV